MENGVRVLRPDLSPAAHRRRKKQAPTRDATENPPAGGRLQALHIRRIHAQYGEDGRQ